MRTVRLHLFRQCPDTMRTTFSPLKSVPEHPDCHSPTFHTSTMGFSSPSRSPGDEDLSLPQYGFGTDFDFDNLVKHNPFLFRVYTPKQRSPFFDDSDPFFVGQKFDEQYTSSSHDISESMSCNLYPISLNSTYDDVARHMDWTTRSSSPFISTSFSFIWSVWEALRRYRTNVKHDIEIAVIDASAVSGKAVTALQLLRKSTPKGRHRDYWKWYRFSQESQSVLVHGAIPGTAVFSSIPLLSIIEKLPSYFLHPHDDDDKSIPLAQVAWDYAEQKPSYRKFCQDMAERFLRLPAETRLRDTTAGSVRLAVAFLRPWFHKVVLDDFQRATNSVRELSFVIAQWPGQWWARDHGEMWDLIRAMVLILAEEVRDKRRGQISEEVRRLQETIDRLEEAVKDYESQISSLSQVTVQVGHRAIGLPTTLMPSDSHITPSLRTTSAPSTFETPMTPIAPSSTVLSSSSSMTSLSSAISSSATDSASSTPPSSSPPSPHSTPPSLPMLSSASTPSEPQKLSATSTSMAPFSPIPSAPPTAEITDQSHSMLETASCLVTGFLFGAFITFFIISSQRRTLLINIDLT